MPGDRGKIASPDNVVKETGLRTSCLAEIVKSSHFVPRKFVKNKIIICKFLTEGE